MSFTRSQHTTLPIPNGWFAVAWSDELQCGEVKRIQAFDEELVLFRTRGGQPAVLDAYCAHLGAHLGEGGRVVGETVRCPFHGWQYDRDGMCVEIPYCKRVPQAARVRSWPVAECNGMIFTWHHAEGKPPSWDVPVLEEFGHPDWTEPRKFELEVPVHMQEMGENNCDPVHFLFVHQNVQIPPSEVSYGNDGRFMRMVSRHSKETPIGTFDVDLVRDAWGLGLVSVRFDGIPGGGMLMYSSTTPIDSHNTISRWRFTVSAALADVAGEEFIEGMSTGVLQDMRIWKNKIHRAEPVFCEADEYLTDFRRWAKQFYSPVNE